MALSQPGPCCVAQPHGGTSTPENRVKMQRGAQDHQREIWAQGPGPNLMISGAVLSPALSRSLVTRQESPVADVMVRDGVPQRQQLCALALHQNSLS